MSTAKHCEEKVFYIDYLFGCYDIC